MPVEPDSVLWGSVLGPWRNHGNVNMGDWAAERLFRADCESSGSVKHVCQEREMS